MTGTLVDAHKHHRSWLQLLVKGSTGATGHPRVFLNAAKMLSRTEVTPLDLRKQSVNNFMPGQRHGNVLALARRLAWLVDRYRHSLRDWQSCSVNLVASGLRLNPARGILTSTGFCDQDGTHLANCLSSMQTFVQGGLAIDWLRPCYSETA